MMNMNDFVRCDELADCEAHEAEFEALMSEATQLQEFVRCDELPGCAEHEAEMALLLGLWEV